MPHNKFKALGDDRLSVYLTIQDLCSFHALFSIYSRKTGGYIFSKGQSSVLMTLLYIKGRIPLNENLREQGLGHIMKISRHWCAIFMNEKVFGFFSNKSRP